jgi:hypothetical protein
LLALSTSLAVVLSTVFGGAEGVEGDWSGSRRPAFTVIKAWDGQAVTGKRRKDSVVVAG